MSSLDQGPRGRRGPPGSLGEKGLVGAQVGLTNSQLNTAAHSPWPVHKDQTVTWEPRAGPGDPAGSQLRRAPHPHCQAALRWAAASSDWCQGADKGMLGAWVSRATCRPGARPGFRSRSGPHQLWPDTPTPGLGTSSTSDASERTERAHG